MKLTKNRLKKLIKEELALGEARRRDYWSLRDDPGPTKEDQLHKLLNKFIDADDVISGDGGLIDQIHQLGITDEVGDENSPEKALFDAISNYYKATGDIVNLMKRPSQFANIR